MSAEASTRPPMFPSQGVQIAKSAMCLVLVVCLFRTLRGSFGLGAYAIKKNTG